MKKKVSFVGKTWDLPEWANFITHDHDSNGAVCAWEKMPVLMKANWKTDTANWLQPGEHACLGHADVKPQIMAV